MRAASKPPLSFRNHPVSCGMKGCILMKNDITTKPILSISMLISGRDEMEKSLKSLQPFKDAFPCEIILVDTGCNEAQRWTVSVLWY